MFLDTKKPKIRVFLPEASDELATQRNVLMKVLSKAEMEVVNHTSTAQATNTIQEHLSKADCSIHILGSKYGATMSAKPEFSLHEMNFNEAKRFSYERNEDFKIFVWHPSSISKNILDAKQERFITSIKNSILHNVTISYQDSPVVLVEDIYSVMNSLAKPVADVKETELFFIYNELDEDSAKDSIELLKDVMQVEEYKMVSSTDADSSNYITEQVKSSKLAVIFFKWAIDWAVPFSQQLWKMTGGASSNTEILLIGDAGQQQTQVRLFNAPRVSSLTVAEELIPLEIKVQYDRLVNKISI